MQNSIAAYFDTVSDNFKALHALAPAVERAAQACIDSIKADGKILICGNGGSAADAQHMAAELTGRYKRNRRGLPGIALTVDSSALTAIGNDFGFEQVFARQVEALGRTGDVLVAISTSGKSPNVLAAIHKAKEMGMTVIGMTGQSGATMENLCDIWIGAPSPHTNHVQEMHLAIEHLICEFVEQAFA